MGVELADNFVHTLMSSQSLSLSSLEHNMTIVVTCSAMLGFFFLGLFFLYRWDNYDKGRVAVEQSPPAVHKGLLRFDRFIDSITPEELKPKPW